MSQSLYSRPTAEITILAAVSVLFWWRPLADTFGLALTNDAYTHILLILPLSAALVYSDWKSLRSKQNDLPAVRSNSRSDRNISLALLALALMLGAYARWGMSLATDDVRLSVAMISLVTWWIASIVLCFGGRTLKLFLLPIFFLFLIVPIPNFALNWIVEFLQLQSARAARIIFQAIRVPVTQDGIMLYVPGLDVEVARECSSIRSSLILIVTTIVLAHLFLTSWWRKLVLVLLAIPLSIAKNGLRIFTIVELGTRVDPKFLNGKLHHNGGVIFLGIGVIAVIIPLWLLRRTELRTTLRHSAPLPQ
jgi:exosortase